MKKLNKAMKILSKEDKRLVKGGGWMTKVNNGVGWGCKKNDNSGCPPPDPTDE